MNLLIFIIGFGSYLVFMMWCMTWVPKVVDRFTNWLDNGNFKDGAYVPKALAKLRMRLKKLWSKK